MVGGDQIGMQAADYLSENGAKVTVAEAHHHFAQKLAANDRWYLWRERSRESAAT